MPRGLGLGLGLLLSFRRSPGAPGDRRFGALPFLLRRLIYYSDGDVSFRRWAGGRRGLCGYAVEQFSDDEYECELDNQKV